MNLTVKEIRAALDAALKTYDNDMAWESADLYVEQDEAGGYMGSDSAYRPIDRDEFAQRFLGALEKELADDVDQLGKPPHRRSPEQDYDPTPICSYCFKAWDETGGIMPDYRCPESPGALAAR